jgi:hypothetical protein
MTTATMMTDTMAKLTETLKAIPGVTAASLWTNVPGRERVYVTLSNKNSGKRDGRRLVVTSAAAVEFERTSFEWSGAATRRWHEENGTIAKIAAAAAAALEADRAEFAASLDAAE